MNTQLDAIYDSFTNGQIKQMIEQVKAYPGGEYNLWADMKGHASDSDVLNMVIRYHRTKGN